MKAVTINIEEGKKIYFASDFHLGADSQVISSKDREQKIIRWLDLIKHDAQAIFLVGDLFDFWFEYKYVTPKGFTRFLGKIAQLTDSGIPIHVFTGNHDMWMFGYLEKEIGITIYREPQEFTIGGKSFYIGHGDGLGPGDRFYKFLKSVFRNKICQWAFSILNPSIGMAIANGWSKKSRNGNLISGEEFTGKNEWLYVFCQKEIIKKHFDFFIFGHRHLPIESLIAPNCYYLNLGEWLSQFTYVIFDGKEHSFSSFESSCDIHQI